MPDPTLDEARSAIETWSALRVSAARNFTHGSLKRFVELSDAQARNLISAMDRTDPDFYDALAELAQVAVGILNRRKVFVNGEDSTPLR